jgi:class 3 adenylate cyclase
MRQFISPDIFYQLLKGPIDLQPKVSFITILFSDLMGFTQLSSKIPPGDLAVLLNRYYFHPLSEVVMKHKGIVDKCIGDSIMALFGAPIYQERHEDNAMRCAIEMVGTLEKNNQGLNMGIGISTGYVVTGLFGSISKKEYTALGMPVNVAARLQKLAQPGEIIISEETKARLDPGIPFKKIGNISFVTSSMPVVYNKWVRNGQV